MLKSQRVPEVSCIAIVKRIVLFVLDPLPIIASIRRISSHIKKLVITLIQRYIAFKLKSLLSLRFIEILPRSEKSIVAPFCRYITQIPKRAVATIRRYAGSEP